MLKTLIIIIAGATIGYFAGFSDAQEHADNVAVRIIHQVGGDSRDRVSADVDKQMEHAEKP
jgi:hypothetical protein